MISLLKATYLIVTCAYCLQFCAVFPVSLIQIYWCNTEKPGGIWGLMFVVVLVFSAIAYYFYTKQNQIHHLLRSAKILCFIFIFNFTTLASLIITGYTMPFNLPEKNRLELANESLVLILNYHLMMLTGFVSDPDRRDDIGTSMIIFTLLYLLINVIFALKDILTKYCYRAKYFCTRQQMIQ